MGACHKNKTLIKEKIVIIYRFIVFKMTKQIIKSQQKKKKMITIWWFSHFKDFGRVFLNFSAHFTFFCKVGCMYSFWFFVPSKWNYFLNCFYHFGAWNDLFCSRNGNFDVIFRNCVTNWTSNKPKLIGRVILLFISKSILGCIFKYNLLYICKYPLLCICNIFYHVSVNIPFYASVNIS